MTHKVLTIHPTKEGHLAVESLAASAGAASSGALVELDASGLIDSSMLPAASSQYRHDQALAALVWNVNHALSGEVDSVNIYVGGRKVNATIDIVDTNNLTITFAIAQLGYAIIEL